MTKVFTLGKNKRLRSRKLIDELFSNGKSISISPFRTVYKKTGNGLQMGVSAVTRNFKKAVDRNRIKRMVREAFRLQKNQLEELLKSRDCGLAVFFIYTEKEMPDYKIVAEGIQKSLKKLESKINETDTTGA